MNKRVLRANELLKKEIGYILLRDIGFDDALVTITRVECTPNLIEAFVYVSVMPDEKISKVFAILRREVYGIQKKINRRMRSRPIPKIVFRKEVATGQADKVEKILEDIDKKD